MEVDKLVKEMDSINMRVMVNLSGGTGDQLKRTVEVMKGRYPDRFIVFANLNFNDLNEPGYGQRAAARLAEDVKNGAQGLKIFKNYGMDLKYKDGRRVHVDDPEFDPVWASAKQGERICSIASASGCASWSPCGIIGRNRHAADPAINRHRDRPTTIIWDAASGVARAIAIVILKDCASHRATRDRHWGEIDKRCECDQHPHDE